MMANNTASKFKSIVFAFFVLNTLYAINNFSFAQKSTSSPYSRYGVGDVSGKGYGQSFAMGGTNIAMQNDTLQFANIFINNGNPASYTNNRLTTAELGANYNRVRLESTTTKKTINNASLAYVSLAFPIKRWWGSSVGLIPYSSVGYKVSDNEVIQNVGSVNFLYEGDGGINQVYWGNAFKPFYELPKTYQKSSKYAKLASLKNPDQTPKNCHQIYHDTKKIRQALNRRGFLQSLSLGANSSYLFGNFTNTRRTVFPAAAFAFNTRTGTTTQVSGLYFDYGMQIAYGIDSVRTKNYLDAAKTVRDTCRPFKYRTLDNKVKFIFGVTFAAQTAISAKIDSLSYSYFNNSLGYEIVKDTISDSHNTKGNLTIPMTFGFGIGFKKGGFLISADYSVQNWSQYTIFNQSQGLVNSMRVSLGAQLIPSLKINASYPERMHYRLGVRYGQTALDLKNTPLTEYAVSAGIGFPVGRNLLLRNFSMVNIGAEVGQMGTTTNGLIKENFFKVSIGFTINDLWFQKPKID